MLYIDTRGDAGEIVLAPAERKNPEPILRAHDPNADKKILETRLTRIKALKEKLKNNSISNGERDELLALLLENLGL